MAWTGRYRLELTCDRQGGHYIKQADGVARDTLGHEYGEFPHVFVGELGAVMRQDARRAGWTVAQSGEAVCPKCKKRQTRRTNEQQTS